MLNRKELENEIKDTKENIATYKTKLRTLEKEYAELVFPFKAGDVIEHKNGDPIWIKSVNGTAYIINSNIYLSFNIAAFKMKLNGEPGKSPAGVYFTEDRCKEWAKIDEVTEMPI